MTIVTPSNDEAMRVAFESLSHNIKKDGYNAALTNEPVKRCLQIMARIYLQRLEDSEGNSFSKNCEKDFNHVSKLSAL